MKKILFILPSLFAMLTANATNYTLSGNASSYDSSYFILSSTADKWHVASGTTFIVDETIELNKKFETAAASSMGDTFYAQGNVIVNANKTFSITSNHTKGNSGTYVNFTNMTLNAGATFHDKMTSQISSLIGNGTLSIGTDATFRAARFRIIDGTVNVNGAINVNTLDTRGNNKTVNSVINFNKAYSIRDYNGNDFDTQIIMMSSNSFGKLTLNINASQQVGNIIFQNNTSVTNDYLTIAFSSGTKLIANAILPSPEDSRQFQKTAFLTLTDFTNESFFLRNDVNIVEITLSDSKIVQAIELAQTGYKGYLVLQGTNILGEALNGFYTEAGTTFDANGTSIKGFWLKSANAVAVPEPAEWAMILGSLAIGLAIYRRRK